MTKHSLLALSVAAVLALGLGTLSYGAQDGPAGPAGPPMMQSGSGDNPATPSFARPGHHGPGLEAIQKKLGITDDQKKQIRGASGSISRSHAQSPYGFGIFKGREENNDAVGQN